ncbi:MAG: glycosyltransferase, partial [Bacteroidota bacterium]
MPKIICITSGLTGILYASFELVHRLETAGHEVIYACPRAVGEQVRANDITYIQLPETNFFPAPALPTFSGALQKIKRLWYKWRYRHKRQQAAIEALGMQHFKAFLKNQNPDLVIIDVELHEHLMTSISEQVPTLLLSQWFSLWNRPGLPPIVSDIIPKQRWQGSSLGIRWAWQKIQWKRWWMFTKQKLRSAGTDRRSILKQYAQTISFPLKYIPENYWPGPFTYHELPVISMTLEEMEFPHDARPHLHYVGPMIAENRNDKSVDTETAQRLQAIYAEQSTNNKALICCTVSSFKAGDPDFLKRLIASVAQQEQWLLIIGLGSKLKAEALGEIPPNVHAFAWIPQTDVLAKAACSINHGGIHTINECIHFQVPMLIYSGKRSDQDGCAARVHYHGLGIMADKDQDDSTTMTRKIYQLLEDKTYQSQI